ncbi:MAG: ATPase [Parvibaculaceae bacterium]|nr:ATPase [Parvibaculaceae bacterium]
MTTKQGLGDMDDVPNDDEAKDRYVSHPGREKTKLPKRFYKQASFEASEGGFAITLDGRSVKTPAKSPLLIPHEKLAKAVAEEWDAQETHIDPAVMHLTRLANTAVDRVSIQRAYVLEELARFGDTELLCYRAENPTELVRLEADKWDPLVAWATTELKAPFKTTSGILHVEQPDTAKKAVEAALADVPDFALAGLHNVISITGSLILGFAILRGRLDAEEAFELAHVDEAYQAELWGEDSEAQERLALRRIELEQSAFYLTLL